eukprot:Rhum_TRINITY_DN13382_c0_g2::Rhum_TRINITY_DN13382_c0_g2_i1::g.59671::m.59671
MKKRYSFSHELFLTPLYAKGESLPVARRRFQGTNTCDDLRDPGTDWNEWNGEFVLLRGPAVSDRACDAIDDAEPRRPRGAGGTRTLSPPDGPRPMLRSSRCCSPMPPPPPPPGTIDSDSDTAEPSAPIERNFQVRDIESRAAGLSVTLTCASFRLSTAMRVPNVFGASSASAAVVDSFSDSTVAGETPPATAEPPAPEPISFHCASPPPDTTMPLSCMSPTRLTSAPRCPAVRCAAIVICCSFSATSCCQMATSFCQSASLLATSILPCILIASMSCSTCSQKAAICASCAASWSFSFRDTSSCSSVIRRSFRSSSRSRSAPRPPSAAAAAAGSSSVCAPDAVTPRSCPVAVAADVQTGRSRALPCPLAMLCIASVRRRATSSRRVDTSRASDSTASCSVRHWRCKVLTSSPFFTASRWYTSTVRLFMCRSPFRRSISLRASASSASHCCTRSRSGACSSIIARSASSVFFSSAPNASEPRAPDESKFSSRESSLGGGVTPPITSGERIRASLLGVADEYGMRDKNAHHICHVSRELVRRRNACVDTVLSWRGRKPK